MQDVFSEKHFSGKLQHNLISCAFIVFFLLYLKIVNPSSIVCVFVFFVYFYGYGTYFYLFGNDEMSAFEREYKSIGLRDKNKPSIS